MALIDTMTLRLASLPASLAGLRLLHVGDLHARGPRPRFDRLVEEIDAAEFDLLCLLGDYMDVIGDEPIAHELVRRIVAAARPRIGSLGVFGNHDSPEMRRRLELLPVRWLANEGAMLAGDPIFVAGLDCVRAETVGDLVTATAELPPPDEPCLRLLLTHLPTWLAPASSFGFDLMLAGHTHGGQCRTPWGQVLINAIDWPLRFAAGVFQYRRTAAVVSRGLGETRCQGLRFFCPPQAVMITLQPSNAPARSTRKLTRRVKW
jgi:predicted MPP superfamily phosphohydrolase